MFQQLLPWLSARKVPLLGGFGLIVLSSSLAGSFLLELSPPVIRMSAGPEDTRRHGVAKYLAEQAGQHDLNIRLTANSGTEDSLSLLKAGQLDVAAVSNGVIVPGDGSITVLAAVQTEAVHVLVRKEMAAGPLGETIRGKKVNVGQKGSTEWLLAREFLAFTRLTLPAESHPGDIVPTEYSKADLIAKARGVLRSSGAERAARVAGLPDCLLVLDTMPSTVVQLLVEAAGYEIVPLLAVRAFLTDNLQEGRGDAARVDRVFLEQTAVPANSYFLNRPYPASDCGTVGVRLLIVARKDVPDRAVRVLMHTLFESEFSRRVPVKSPREVATPYAVHPAAAAYLDRDKPLLVKELMDLFMKAFSVFGALSAVTLFVYGMVWKKKVRSPSDYYAEIRKVDLIARGVVSDTLAPVQPKDLMRYLDDRLGDLRRELVEDICEGRIKADQIIANILTLLNDTRRNLPHLAAAAPRPHFAQPGSKVA